MEMRAKRNKPLLRVILTVMLDPEDLKDQLQEAIERMRFSTNTSISKLKKPEETGNFDCAQTVPMARKLRPIIDN